MYLFHCWFYQSFLQNKIPVLPVNWVTAFPWLVTTPSAGVRTIFVGVVSTQRVEALVLEGG